jgi:hypothetical protein
VKKPDITSGLQSLKKRKKIKLPTPPGPGERRPDFGSLTRPAIENPFDVDPTLTQGLEGDADEEVSAALQAVLDERSGRRDAYRVTNDQNYYCVLCFQSEGQKKEFLDRAGWSGLGERLIDGLRLARLMGVDIDPINLPLSEFSRDMPVGLRDKEVIR